VNAPSPSLFFQTKKIPDIQTSSLPDPTEPRVKPPHYNLYKLGSPSQVPRQASCKQLYFHQSPLLSTKNQQIFNQPKQSVVVKELYSQYQD
jgi:hypothetical protein